MDIINVVVFHKLCMHVQIVESRKWNFCLCCFCCVCFLLLGFVDACAIRMAISMDQKRKSHWPALAAKWYIYIYMHGQKFHMRICCMCCVWWEICTQLNGFSAKHSIHFICHTHAQAYTHNKHIIIYTYDYNSNSGGQWTLVSTICTMDKKETKNIHL